MQKKIYLLSAIILCGFLKLSAQLSLNLPDQTVSCNETLTIPVTVQGFTGMRGLSYSIKWDPSEVAYEGSGTNMVTSKLPGNAIFSNPGADIGQISLLWFNGTPVTLNDGDTIMLFTVRIKGSSFDSTAVAFSDDPVVREGNNGSIITLTSNDGMLRLQDTEMPTLNCQDTVRATIPAGSTAGAVNNIAPALVNDNCGIDSISYQLSGVTTGTGMNDASGQQFNVGRTTVTYTVKDFKGNTNTCSFEVIVEPSGPIDTTEVNGGRLIAECGNTINIPFNVIGFQEITSLQLNLDWDTSKFTYVGISNFDLADLNLSNFNVGEAAMGKVSLNWQNVVPQTKTNGASIFELQLTPKGTLSNEPVTISNLSIDKNAADFPAKSTNASVSIQDNQVPSITCPSNQITTTESGSITALFNGLTPTVSDNCGMPTYDYILTGATTGSGVGDASGRHFNLGVTTVNYRVTDGSGNSNTCSFTATVMGEELSNFTLIAQSKNADCAADDISIDINVALFDSINGTQFSVNWDPNILEYVSTDNIQFPNDSGFDELDVNSGRLGYSWFNALTESLPNGSTLFTLHFKPKAGGTSDITFTSNPTPIEINHRNNGINQVIPLDSINLTKGGIMVMDAVAPTITCQNDTTIHVAMGQSTAVVHGLDPIADDNCGIASITYTLSGATIGSGMNTASGQTFNVGPTTITYKVTDGGGNTTECTRVVRVNAPNAIQINAITGVANCGDNQYRVDITVDSFNNVRGLQFSVNWDQSVLTYDSTANLGLAGLSAASFNTSFINDGKLSVAWFNIAGSGETLANGTVLFSIYFKVIGGTGAFSNLIIGDDPVPKEGNISFNGANMAVPVVGNSSQLTVVDNTVPTISNPLPDTIYRYVNADSCRVIGNWTEPSFSDQCSDNLNLSRSFAPTATFEVGEYKIRYAATDDGGNSAVDSALLIVRDTIKPVFINCPSDTTITPDANCEAIVSWLEPDVSDNCAAIIVTSSTHNPGDKFTATSTTVTYTAEDPYGNVATCSFVVSLENINPIVFDNFPGNITVNSDANGLCGLSIGWLAPTVSGGCNNSGEIKLESNYNPGDTFSIGTTAVIYTASDSSGQSVSDTFNVTVNRANDPVTLCPQDIEIQADGSMIQDPLGFINNVITDSCGEYVITYNDIRVENDCGVIRQQVSGPTSGSTFSFGATMLEFLVIDTIKGDSTTCSFQIKINETKDLQATTLDNPTCAGADLRLSVDTLIGGTYQWTGPGGFTSDLQNPVIPNAMTQNSGEYIVKVISRNKCSIKDSISVGILSAPEITATGNSLSCTKVSDTIRLTATVTNGIPVQTYTWTGPANFTTDVQNPIIPNATVANVGQYVVTATSSNGCTDIDTVVVDLAGMVMPELSTNIGNDSICLGEAFTITGTSYPGNVNHIWIAPNGAGLPATTDSNVLSILPTAAGTYTYSYSVNLDGNCTSDTAQVSLVVREGVGQITLGSNGPLECVANTDSIKLTATGGQNVQSYAWTGPNGFTSSAQNPSLLAANNAAGTYVLVATAPGGCQTRDSINVAVTAQGIAPMITIGGGKTNICEGDELSLSVDTIQGATYAWSGPNNFASTDQNVKIANTTVSNAGAYQLVVTVNGCTSAPRTVGPINILTDPDINADAVDAIVNQSMTFNVTTNDTLIAGVPFTISVVSGAKNGTLTNNNDGTFGYQPKSNFAGTDQIAYEICYTDCSSLCGMAVVTIRTEYPKDSCVVPTLVSPNGDGFNDALFISCVSSPPKQGSELIIWNEWGSEVYRKEAYDNSWQGTYNGKDLPDGTYYYVYKRDSDDNNPQKGYFTLFR